MKRLFVVFLMFLTMPAFAAGMQSNQLDGAGWRDLSEEQKAVVIQEVAKTAKQNAQGGSVDAGKVNQWVDVGERIGKMIGGVAKEVGVAVNEFVKTPVGKMAMMIIVWHYMGSVLVHLVGGAVVLIVGFGFIFYMMRRVRAVTYQYSGDKTDILGRSRLVQVHREPMPQNYVVGYTFAGAAVMAVALITAFSF